MAGYQFFIRHLFRFCPVISNHSFKKPGLLQTFILNIYFWIHSRNCRKKLQFLFSRTRSTSLCPFQKVSQFNDVQKKYKRIFCLTWKSLLCLMSSLSIWKGVLQGFSFFVIYYPWVWPPHHQNVPFNLRGNTWKGKKRHIVRCACFVAYTHICIQYLEVSSIIV